MKNIIPNSQKNYIFLFSEDYINWKLITISHDFNYLMKVFIPMYLKNIGIQNDREIKTIINGLLSEKRESIVFINNFFRIKEIETHNILHDYIILHSVEEENRT